MKTKASEKNQKLRRASEPVSSSYYIVTFREGRDNSPQVIKAKIISKSKYGLNFLALKDFIFDTGAPVVHSQEQTMALRFEDIEIFHLAIHAIYSIEERFNDLPLSSKITNPPSQFLLED